MRTCSINALLSPRTPGHGICRKGKVRGALVARNVNPPNDKTHPTLPIHKHKPGD